jgi:hypothetical protein
MKQLTPAFLLLAACSGAKGGFGSGGGQSTVVGGGGGGDDAGSADTGGGDTGGSDTAGGDTGASDSGGDGGSDELKGTGYDVGDIAYDLIAPASDGSYWSLYLHAGQPIVLVVGHADDFASTASVAAGLVAADDIGATTVGLIGRDEYGVQADEEDAARLALLLGVSPLLYDPAAALVNTWSQNAPPKTYLFSSELEILYAETGTADADAIIAASVGR